MMLVSIRADRLGIYFPAFRRLRERARAVAFTLRGIGLTAFVSPAVGQALADDAGN